MKKALILSAILFLSGLMPVLANFYICRGEDCAMYVIEHNDGFSWYIECMDGNNASGHTDGASYGGSCEQVTIQ